MSAKDIFVTGTDTNIGKTVLSALLCAAENRTYWKPIQSGLVERSDRESVMAFAGIPESQTLAETYRFLAPLSPHLSARLAGMQIDLKAIRRPATPEPLVIEGVGGVLVPLNDSHLMIDLMTQLNAPVVVAARTALGTINHTLLTVQALRGAGLRVRGIVLIGDENDENQRAIEKYGKVSVLGRIPALTAVNRDILLSTYDTHFKAWREHE